VVKVEVMARYHQAPVSAELRLEAGKWMLQFAQPVWALATGQSAVLYQGEECLGGGFFAET
jgi:tRNA-specific 2-thiouridylase